MKSAATLFKQLKLKRSHKSQPKDAEEALKNRDDKQWKIADSAFKLLDKFGYLAMLGTAAKCLNDGLDPK